MIGIDCGNHSVCSSTENCSNELACYDNACSTVFSCPSWTRRWPTTSCWTQRSASGRAGRSRSSPVLEGCDGPRRGRRQDAHPARERRLRRAWKTSSITAPAQNIVILPGDMLALNFDPWRTLRFSSDIVYTQSTRWCPTPPPFAALSSSSSADSSTATPARPRTSSAPARSSTRRSAATTASGARRRPTSTAAARSA